MKLAKISLSALGVVGLGAALFLIARRRFPSPVVNTEAASLVFTGVSDIGYINGPEAMLTDFAQSVPGRSKAAIEAAADSIIDWEVVLAQNSYLDNDRPF